MGITITKKAEAEGEIGGVKICHGAPNISHLLFADDSLILARANGEDVAKLQGILDLYAECTGQVINKGKSAIMLMKDRNGDQRRVNGCQLNFFQTLATIPKFNPKRLYSNCQSHTQQLVICRP